jgi:N-acetyl-gamma-glutamylphosphate reductase
MLKVGVLGASGMIGMQLTRLLSNHSKVATVYPFSERLAGSAFSSLHPAFRDLEGLSFKEPKRESLKLCDVLFMSVFDYEPYLGYLNENPDAKVIDAGSGFRVASDAGQRSATGHCLSLDLAQRFVSVVPEINPQALLGKSWITTQGCVSTAVALALYPLLKGQMLSDLNVTADAKVASSGSGNSSNSHRR